MIAPIVRISRGRFEPGQYQEIKEQLIAARQSLIPAIRSLPGLLNYYVGIDAVTSTMINVSLWDSLEHAQQMSGLAPMLALASMFQQLGVQFDTIANHETLWEVSPPQ